MRANSTFRLGGAAGRGRIDDLERLFRATADIHRQLLNVADQPNSDLIPVPY